MKSTTYPKNRLYWSIFFECLYYDLKFRGDKNNLRYIGEKAKENEELPALINNKVKVLVFYIAKIERTIAFRLLKKISSATRARTVGYMLNKRDLYPTYFVHGSEAYVTYNNYYVGGKLPKNNSIMMISLSNKNMEQNG